MKRETSIRNAKKISDRLKKLGGIIGTPECEHRGFKIKRAWLFGSTVKGKDNPGDTDILIEGHEVGTRSIPHNRPHFSRDFGGKGDNKMWSVAHGETSCGLVFGKESRRTALLWLRSGMKMVRIHHLDVDGSYGDIPETKVMIYPKWNL